MNEAIASLSEREKEALRLLLAGHDAKSIARVLNLSVYTINDRLRQARRKLDVSSSREAARLLGQAEEWHPKSFAPKKLGVADNGKDAEEQPRTASFRGISRRIWWLIGGLAMFFLAVAAIMMAFPGLQSQVPEGGNPTVPDPGTINAMSEDKALKWLALVDDSRWGDSWDKTGAVFQDRISKENWATTISSVRKPLGLVEARSLAQVTKTKSLPSVPEGDYEILAFQTNFATRNGAIETVVLSKEQTGWKVVGYFIR